MTTATEKIKQMIISALESADISSASPEHTNKVEQINFIDSPDFDDVFSGGDEETTKQAKKQEKKVDDALSAVDEFKRGNVGKVSKMSSEQFGNLRELATNPFSFMTQTMLRKFKTGAGVLFISAIAVEVAKFLILELFKPGRIFDQRFRERIDKQIIQFLDRKEQQELRQKFKSIITTTIGGLRGDSLRGQLGGNFYQGGQFGVSALAYDPSLISPPNFNSIDNRKKSFQSVGPGSSRGRRR